MQKTIILKARPRGFHLITDEILDQLPELRQWPQGVLHLFIQHTSASLSVNENADPDVRQDMESFANQAIPDRSVYFRHKLEGEDDMPAHVKASLFGCSLSIPVSQGRLLLGTWQGIYLGEHRNRGGRRHIVATLLK